MGSMKAVLATFVVMTVGAASCISCAAGTEPELRAPPDLHDGFSVSSPASVGLDPTPIAGLADAVGPHGGQWSGGGALRPQAVVRSNLHRAEQAGGRSTFRPPLRQGRTKAR